MKVIATAGHVDHGKSMLVRALSGIDPDRLREEKARGMTIDLGFAWTDLPSGEAVGIVDVPGHIDFIKNMLAGMGGVDAALLVVAADEGVMPQTREHLAILDLLEVQRGVVALTKIDLIDEAGWLELVREEVQTVLAPTSLAGAEIVPVSAQTREGLSQLLGALQKVLAQAPDRTDWGRPRLPIDRVFTMSGFGTVVTGTLQDGRLQLGDEVVIEPGGLKARIRGLQTHKKQIQVAQPGSRVAVNLSGLSQHDLHRGQMLALPATLRAAKRLDVRLRALPDAPIKLRHNMEITFHCYATEVSGRLRLLEDDTLAPGAVAWAQIELAQPVALWRGDRFIIRRPSPSNTLGGGLIVDPAVRRRHKRRRPHLFSQLQTLLHGTPADILQDIIHQQGPLTGAQAIAAAEMPTEQTQAALQTLLADGRIKHLNTDDAAHGMLWTPAAWSAWQRQLVSLLDAYHHQNPLRPGIPRQELKSRLQPPHGWSTRLFNNLLQGAVDEQSVREEGATVALPDFRIRYTAAQQAQVDQLLQQFSRSPYMPPSVKQCLQSLDEELFNSLLIQQTLVRVAPDVVFARQTFDEMVATIKRVIQTQGQITVADGRDLFHTSRKYMLALLEYLDEIRVTRRQGDVRVLR
ncbi:MAG: selenocysteine-specific translation elongation factor [Chloroflexi bacterium]|nr:selenocysteine-specific translation elongation factor [Chloroflexota bacterium]